MYEIKLVQTGFFGTRYEILNDSAISVLPFTLKKENAEAITKALHDAYLDGIEQGIKATKESYENPTFYKSIEKPKRRGHQFTSETGRAASLKGHAAKKKQRQKQRQRQKQKSIVVSTEIKSTPKKPVLTDEGRRKISEAVSRPVSINGVNYRSIKQAAEALGLPRSQVKQVIKGINSVDHYRNKNIEKVVKANVDKRLEALQQPLFKFV